MITFKKISASDAAEICDEELLERVSESGDIGKDDSLKYLAIVVNGLVIGFWVYHFKSSVCIQLHINILKKYRNMAYEVSKVFLSQLFKNEKRCQRIECEIPECYPEVIAFSEKFGFKPECIKRNATTRNNVLMSVYLLSLLRSDFYELR